MRIEYSGTPLEGVLTVNKTRPVDFVHPDRDEFFEWREEARGKKILEKSDDCWFTVICCKIVFYLEA